MNSINYTIALLLLCAISLFAQPPGGQPQPEFIRKAQALIREDKLQDALNIYLEELKITPNSVPALNAAGVVLDLMGRHTDARQYFAKAVEVAPNEQAKANANRQIAMSYAFQNDCLNTIKYEQKVIDYWVTKNDAYQQGEMANEAARVCIEAGDLKNAEKWYLAGREMGLKETNISSDRKALWEFRTEHALARLAARRKQKAEAAKHIAAAKTILDSNPEMAKAQTVFFPYLTGYVAYYGGDYKKALADFQQARQDDAFIQCLIGMTYEKLGDKEKAREMYSKAAKVTGYNPPAAFGRPFATKKLMQK